MYNDVIMYTYIFRNIGADAGLTCEKRHVFCDSDGVAGPMHS